MNGFDPIELMRSIEEVIPEHERPNPVRSRTPDLLSQMADTHLQFARVYFAKRGELDKTSRLHGLTVNRTDSDMPLVLSAATASGNVVVFDRGVLGAISHVASFLALYRGFDASRSASAVVSAGPKPVDKVVAYFFRAYFRGLRWAGNFVQRFEVVPEGSGVLLKDVVRYWAVSFLLLHEIAHVANGDTGGAPGADSQVEIAADEVAIEMTATLAQSRIFDEDPGFALVGAQAGLMALAYTEWAYFLTRPITHAPAIERLEALNTRAFRQMMFPIGSLLWSKDVVEPVARLGAVLAEPLLPSFESNYRHILSSGRFFLPAQVGLDRSLQQLQAYESFDRHMNYPLEAQMEILSDGLSLSAQDAPGSAKQREGLAWCESHLTHERHAMLRAAADGIGFRDAIDLSAARWAGLPYSVRVAAMAWCLREVGWRPEAERELLVPAWLQDRER